MVMEKIWEPGFQSKFYFRIAGSRFKSIVRFFRSIVKSLKGEALPVEPGKANVLFIGRDAPWYRVLREALKSQGDVAQTTLEEAKKELQRRKYTLIVVDTAGLSEESIRLTVKRLRKLQPQSYIVFASASPSWRPAREALRAGASDYIVKSYDPRRTIKALELYLQPRRERRHK